MTPIAIALAAAAGYLGYKFYDKNKAAPAYVAPGQAAGQTSGVVSSLTQGKTYAVLIVVNEAALPPTDSAGTAVQAPDANGKAQYQAAAVSNIIKSTFESAGAKVLSQPTVRDSTELQKFVTGAPSTWMFNMQWTKPDPYIGVTPSWLSNAMFVLLPIN